MENIKVTIYGLVDPLTNEIRYVGKTQQPLKKRLYAHIKESEIKSTHKCCWIKKLSKLNLKPIIIELEICTQNTWIEREKYWIQAIENLTNIQVGGGCVNVDEINAKISKGVKNAWDTPEYRDKMSKIRTEYWANHENRQKHGEKIKGVKRTESHKKILSDEMKNRFDTKTRSNNTKKYWENPEYRDKISNFWNSDGQKKKVSERFKGVKQKSETLIKKSNSCKTKKRVIANGVEYQSITEAYKSIPMDREKLRWKLTSDKYPEYYFIEG